MAVARQENDSVKQQYSSNFPIRDEAKNKDLKAKRELEKANELREQELEGQKEKAEKSKSFHAKFGILIDAAAFAIGAAALVALPPVGVLIAGAALAGTGTYMAYKAVSEGRKINNIDKELDKIKGKEKEKQKSLDKEKTHEKAKGEVKEKEKQEGKEKGEEKKTSNRSIKQGLSGLGFAFDAIAAAVAIAAFVVLPPVGALVAAAVVAGVAIAANVTAEAVEYKEKLDAQKTEKSEGKGKERVKEIKQEVSQGKEKSKSTSVQSNDSQKQKTEHQQASTSEKPQSGKEAVANIKRKGEVKIDETKAPKQAEGPLVDNPALNPPAPVKDERMAHALEEVNRTHAADKIATCQNKDHVDATAVASSAEKGRAEGHTH